MSNPVPFEFSQLCDAAVRVQEFWMRQGIEFCFIGGLAVNHWGETRMTQDIDASVSADFGSERIIIGKLLEDIAPRIADAADFAEIHRVVLGQEPGGVPIDISLAALPYELQVIERAEWVELLPGKSIRLCTPGDLITLKAFANRPLDWRDIRGVIIRNNRLLDWPQIESDLGMLTELREEPEILTQLIDLRQELKDRT